MYGRLEVFDREYGFVDKAAVTFTKYEYDYIAIGDMTITASKILKASKRDFIILTTANNKIQAYITALEYGKSTTILKCRPLIGLLDMEVYCNTAQLPETIEAYLQKLITDTFITNTDPLEAIPGFTVQCITQTPRTTTLTECIVNIYNEAIEALKADEIILDMQINIQKKQIQCRIGKPQADIKTIECQLPNIITASVTVKSTGVSFNKVTVIDDKTDQKYTFYQEISGNVTTAPKSRVLPVISTTVKAMTGEDFYKSAYDTAYKQMFKQDYNHYIKVEVAEGDSRIRIDNFSIGQQVRIIKDNTEYISVYTGYKWEKTITFFFGLVRTEYTKQKTGGKR